MWRRVSGSPPRCSFFFFNDTATTEIYTLSLHDALPIYCLDDVAEVGGVKVAEEAHEAPVIAPMQKHVGVQRLRRMALRLERLACLVASLEVFSVEREAHPFLSREHRVGLRAGPDQHRFGG